MVGKTAKEKAILINIYNNNKTKKKEEEEETKTAQEWITTNNYAKFALIVLPLKQLSKE